MTQETKSDIITDNQDYLLLNYIIHFGHIKSAIKENNVHTSAIKKCDLQENIWKSPWMSFSGNPKNYSGFRRKVSST